MLHAILYHLVCVLDLDLEFGSSEATSMKQCGFLWDTIRTNFRALVSVDNYCNCVFLHTACKCFFLYFTKDHAHHGVKEGVNTVLNMSLSLNYLFPSYRPDSTILLKALFKNTGSSRY